MSQSQAQGASAEFILRKLHSLTGFFPLCFFFLFHLLANSIALTGLDNYEWFVLHFTSLPGIKILEWIMIFIPLGLHLLMGVWLVATGRNNPLRYSYERNWMFFFQRVSGVILVLFLIWHIISMKTASAAHGSMLAVMQQTAQNPLLALFMAISLIAVSFHVCNGLWGFCINWGIASGKRAQRVLGRICLVLFVLTAIHWLLVFKAFM